VAAELPHRDGPPPPKLGEHTKEILRGLGISEREFEDLRLAGSIA